MHIRTLIFLFIFSVHASQIKSQNIQYGIVSPKDFDVTKLNVDTSKGAVIISDVGISSFEGNNKSWFTLIYKRKRRILITNKIGFDMATVSVPLYVSTKDRNEEKLAKLQGSTYNLVDGKVVETKINPDDIFKDKLDKNHFVKKFTFPAVKEGSIIEYSYTINSDFLFNLQPWTFQESYPSLLSQYEVDLPDFFEYIILKQGYLPFENEQKNHHGVFSLMLHEHGIIEGSLGKVDNESVVSLSVNVTDYKWTIKNVPALNEEKFTSSINNHVAKLDFQLAGIRFPDEPYDSVMGDWNTTGKKLLKDDEFGSALSKSNSWLDEDMKVIVSGATTPLEKTRKIYYYVKNNIASTDEKGILLSQPLKDVFKNKRGSVADINLLLTAMLIHEKIIADPVISSTRKHGFTKEEYPILSKYNYVITRATIGEDYYFLDASQKYLSFRHLPEYCYNGHARVITQTPEAVYFNADALQEIKVTNVMLYNSDRVPGEWEGSSQSTLGYYESMNAREKMSGTGESDFEKSILKSDYTISNLKFVNQEDYEKPLQINYDIKLGEGKADIIYFNPMIKQGYSENPFKSSDRKYPVEMPYQINETYSLSLDIPTGYEVAEMPQSTKISLNGNDGFFEYIITKSDEGINMRSKIKLDKATFAPEDYQTLRSFFASIVKKHGEQIVFKKKK